VPLGHDPCLRIGDLRIDPAAREVALAGDERLPLTKTEFDLMAYLAARPGAVVTHTELLREVLGYDPQVETKALVMHIANIRRKIDQHCPLALTITGRFRPPDSPGQEEGLRRLLVERHPELGELAKDPAARVLIVRGRAFQLLDGISEAHFLELD
jgi:hypothetical protein